MAGDGDALATGGLPRLITDAAVGAAMISGLLPVAVLGLIELSDEQPNSPAGAASGPLL